MPSSNGDDDERIMNDSTMPPPPSRAKKTPAVPSSSGDSSVPPRRKTGRFGLSEWNRLVSVSNDLAQLNGQPLRRIPISEIRQHDTALDGWISLRGKVYRISPYLAYHPGGETVMNKVLGRDATALFDKYHPWVNEDG
jgi:cytochrome b involved in lipid metabolism